MNKADFPEFERANLTQIKFITPGHQGCYNAPLSSRIVKQTHNCHQLNIGKCYLILGQKGPPAGNGRGAICIFTCMVGFSCQGSDFVCSNSIRKHRRVSSTFDHDRHYLDNMRFFSSKNSG